MRDLRFQRSKVPTAAAALLASICFCASVAHGQSKNSSFSGSDLEVSVSDADRAGAGSVVRGEGHANYARTAAGVTARNHDAMKRQSLAASAAAANSQVVGESFTQNPGDVTYFGGPVLQYAVSHAVYINPGGACTISGCWGNPEGFLADVSDSDFIHVLDQYAGVTANRRYTVGSRAVLKGNLSSNSLSESDLIAILHGVVSKTGAAGYGNIYHLFLAPGIDTCFDAPANNVCYSPDNLATFAFCAYHDNATFTDLGLHVIFTVEPSQLVPGCEDAPTGAPNSLLIDSTNDTLSHELSETISDPDLDAWFNNSSFSLAGSEIGDECLFADPFTNIISEPTFRIDGKLYRIQSEYSNDKHACAISPKD
jgi:hypothetical protein